MVHELYRIMYIRVRIRKNLATYDRNPLEILQEKNMTMAKINLKCCPFPPFHNQGFRS
jgi:hypothetical protein